MKQSGVAWKGILLWILVPLGLLALGYFILGPKIGNVPILPSKDVGGTKQVAVNVPPPPPGADQNSSSGDFTSADSTSTGTGDASSGSPVVRNGDPDITITVQRGGDFTVRPGRRERYDRYGRTGTYRHRRRSRRVTAPSDTTGAPAGGTDAGGSGGDAGF